MNRNFNDFKKKLVIQNLSCLILFIQIKNEVSQNLI
jgi:hypothetical protein